VANDQTIYDVALVDAVKNFQRRLGRDPNGRIDAQTQTDLNVPLSRLELKLEGELDRTRAANPVERLGSRPGSVAAENHGV
jgi:murein L,D-transpeptidase YcbB/YkuD